MRADRFISPEIFERDINKRQLHGPNGWILFVGCNDGLHFAENVKNSYDRYLRDSGSDLTEIPLLNDFKAQIVDGKASHRADKSIIRTFEDTETGPWLPYHVAGSNAYVFSTVHDLDSGSLVNENLMQLYQMIRALKVNGAKTVTAVVPYLPYSRQDKPTTFMREATISKLVADFFVESGAQGILTYHPHSESIRGFYEPRMRYTALNGLDLFLDIAGKFKNLDDVCAVSTDAGGAKSTIYLAQGLNVDYAIANKYRHQAEQAEILGIIGNVNGKRVAILADDETVTMTSLNNAANELHTRYSVSEIHMLISHAKLRPQHVPRLIKAHQEYGLQMIHFTDTVPQTKILTSLPFVTTHSLAGRFARTINRLHYNQSVSELSYNPNRRKDPRLERDGGNGRRPRARKRIS